jgi:hypothetical protein
MDDSVPVTLSTVRKPTQGQRQMSTVMSSSPSLPIETHWSRVLGPVPSTPQHLSYSNSTKEIQINNHLLYLILKLGSYKKVSNF